MALDISNYGNHVTDNELINNGMNGGNPKFDYTPLNPNCELTDDALDLLSRIDAQTNCRLFGHPENPCPIELPKSLGDIHRNLLENVIVSDEKKEISINISVKDRINELKDLLDKLKEEQEKEDEQNPFDLPLEEGFRDPMDEGQDEIDFPEDNNQDPIPQLEKEISDLEGQYGDNPDATIHISYSLLGEYVSDNPHQLPVVYLYINNIKAACKNPAEITKLVAVTYVHEMMHAYYNAATLFNKPYYRNMEEALAEFGMLTFFRDFRDYNLLNFALNNVRAKIKSPGISCYGYGYYLFTQAYPYQSRINSTLSLLTRMLPIAFRCNNLKLDTQSSSFKQCDTILGAYNILQGLSEKALNYMMETLFDQHLKHHIEMLKHHHDMIHDMCMDICMVICMPFHSGKSITEATICYGVKRIPNFCFSECSQLNKVVIPNSVEKIGDNSFMACSVLPSIQIPNSIKEIEFAVFESDNIASLVIPNSVQKIAYLGDNNFREITILNPKLKMVKGSFNDYSALVAINIPYGSLSHFQKQLDPIVHKYLKEMAQSGIICNVLCGPSKMNQDVDISQYYKRKTKYSQDAQNAIDSITSKGVKKTLSRTEVFSYFWKAQKSQNPDDFYTAFIAAMMWGNIVIKFNHDIDAFNAPNVGNIIQHVSNLINSRRIFGAIKYLSDNNLGKIKGVNYAFFTKIIYFCSNSTISPRPLIFDKWGKLMHVAMLIDDNNISDLNRWYGGTGTQISILTYKFSDEIYEDYILRMEKTASRYGMTADQLEEFLFGQGNNGSTNNPRARLIYQVRRWGLSNHYNIKI